jgi:probable rRNA maturation factor
MPPPEESPVLFRRAPAGLRRGEIREFARRLRAEVAGGRGFGCLVSDDRELRRLNLQFLGQDRPTDVLSFPENGADGFLGEIAISGERAREQAAGQGHGVEEEIRILMLHGVLHLMGMDHHQDRGRMARAEAAWRRKLGLAAGLIERARS